VCDLETSRMGAPYIYDISRLRVKDLHSATYIYVVRRLRVNHDARNHGFKKKNIYWSIQHNRVPTSH